MFRAYKVFLATAYPQREIVSAMKRLLTCLVLFASFSASAQVIYPYNPDANGDSAITSGDLLDFLPVFATTFTPQGITIDGVPLDEWLDGLEVEVNSNAASIESLFAMQSQINSLQAANNQLQVQVNSLQDQLDNLSFNIDGLPPCSDLDDNGICDFAESCPPFPISFQYSLPNSGTVFATYILPGGYYPDAHLSEAILTGACLHGTDLNEADLSYSLLDDADMSSANLSDVDLTFASLNNADLQNTNFAGSNLDHASLIGSNPEGANFTQSTLSSAIMGCLRGCPSHLPPGYVCIDDDECGIPNRYQILLQIEGCLDPNADNFNPFATDDGPCNYGNPCTSPSFDNYTYEVVQIAGRCWFAENLRTTTYENGDPIPNNLSVSEWMGTDIGASAVYGEGSSPCSSFGGLDLCEESNSLINHGRLYNFYATQDSRGLCPAGWRVANDEDWNSLDSLISFSEYILTPGAAVADTSVGGSDILGFSALPGGCRSWSSGEFQNGGVCGYFWSSDACGAGGPRHRVYIFNWSVWPPDGCWTANQGLSVRCVRSAE